MDNDNKVNKRKVKKYNSIEHRKQGTNGANGASRDYTKFILSSLGNATISNLVGGGFLQAKLNMSTPGDMYEKQADKAAEQVMKSNTSNKTGPKIDKIQSKGSSGGKVPTDTEAGIKNLKGKGSTLNRPLRDYFEPRYGTDLGNVRVHTGNNADKLAESVNARAFTHGNDIVFKKGEFQPGTKEGKKLIAHELAHVQQQKNGIQLDVQRDFGIEVNHEKKTKALIIRANYYTTSTHLTHCQNILNVWNRLSKEYYYRVGNKKAGFEYYPIEFKLVAVDKYLNGKQSIKTPAQAHTSAIEVDNTSNSFEVKPPNSGVFKEKNRGAGTGNKKFIYVKNTKLKEEVSQIHEVGHTLIGGKGHHADTYMGAALKPASEKDEVGNFVKEQFSIGIVRDILASAGLGKKSAVKAQRHKDLQVEKGEGYDSLPKDGMVLAKKDAERQITRKTER